MDLINNWRKIAGMNQPTLPGQPPSATPPFVPKPGETGYQPSQPNTPFGTKSPLQPIQTPNRAGRFPEVTVPQREKVGIDKILPQIETPERDKKYAENDIWQIQNMDRPWYKDGAFMTELGGRLSNAFGGLTTRGNSHAETMINAQKVKDAQAMRSSNKSMDFLIKNNPEMASKLMALPPGQRDKFMQLALAQSAGLQSGDESAFAEKVRMYKSANPGVTDAEAIDWAKGGSGTNIDIDMGGGAGPFEEKLGEKAAEWMGGRRITSGQNRAEAGIVIDRLEQAVKNGENITGDWSSYLPDSARNLFGAEGLELQQDVERIVQQSLKETLGAQFAQKEAEQLFARTWNPKASPEVNLRRVRRLMDELDAYAANMDGLTEGMISSNGNIMQYLQENPELAGAYTANSIYGLNYDDDFDTAGVTRQPEAPKTGGVVMDGKTYYYNEATGEYETDD